MPVNAACRCSCNPNCGCVCHQRTAISAAACECPTRAALDRLRSIFSHHGISFDEEAWETACYGSGERAPCPCAGMREQFETELTEAYTNASTAMRGYNTLCDSAKELAGVLAEKWNAPDADVHYVGPTVLRGMAGGELANLGDAVYVIQVDGKPVAVLCSYATATEAEQDDAGTLQANRVARDLLAQMEARAVAAEGRVKALEAALRDLRTAARNGRGLISRMRDYVPVASEFWERYSEAQIAEMLAALETADERAAAALKGEA